MTTATRPVAPRRTAPTPLKRKRRDLNIHRGIPNRLDATEARDHVALLRKTMSWTHIATVGGCSACYLRDIADGSVPVINRVTHEKIMAVQPAPARDPGFYIDAIGTRRRVRALMADGHSQYVIAAAAGTTQHRIGLISRGAPRVRQMVADKVAVAYEALAGTQGTSTRARGIAAAEGWQDGAYWADVDRIDDADFDPTAKALRIEQIAEDAEWLQKTGLDLQQVAERMGFTRGYVEKALRHVRRAIEAKWAARTVPTDGGHLAWTGAYTLRYGDHLHSPAAIAFRIRTGRDPVGNALADCGRWRCVQPAHVEDQVGRQRTRTQLRAVLGLKARPAVCANGHDQTTHGRLDAQGHAYCDTCVRGTEVAS